MDCCFGTANLDTTRILLSDGEPIDSLFGDIAFNLDRTVGFGDELLLRTP